MTGNIVLRGFLIWNPRYNFILSICGTDHADAIKRSGVKHGQCVYLYQSALMHRHNDRGDCRFMMEPYHLRIGSQLRPLLDAQLANHQHVETF